ncbi:AAA family ATPase [Winogradskyella arenosi]|uniref:RecA-family ATPase n=1 Tax=Winogradskyella arenosi TaxID=533325 RepID=A0A368ZER5_9FLAO|nr:AAA family ATPase [Winogradskyella arenosi]RCW90115.1 RecA-family ATPase [Winogradskyella arenosi]
MRDFYNKIEEFSTSCKATEKQFVEREEVTGCLIVKPANTWVDEAKSRPIPKMLFSEFIYEGEVSVLFADTNVGKSILAVQIADSISSGISIEGFEIETAPKKVAYLDFELSDKQFEKRYSQNYQNHYMFHNNFLRAEIDPDLELPKNFDCIEDYLNHSFSTVVEKHQAEVLIIDNITFLKSDNERAKDALLIMKHLKKLNRNYGITIIVLAHTPKRNAINPITKNDLAGSKMLMNFCDSAFAIGESATEPDIRYVKQIKQRNTEKIYHENNVVMCRISQPYNFLKFEFLGYSTEQEHLRTFEANTFKERDSQILELKNEGLTNTKIAMELGVSEGTIRNRLKKIA